MTTETEDASVEHMKTALLRRCQDTLTAFSEREFERNMGHTYVPGCTPPALANRAEAFVPADPRKRAYREATHVGGQGIILAQPPTAALERAYVDQPICPAGGRADAIPSRGADRSCPIRTAHWGRVRPRSKPVSKLEVDYADEPTIKAETPTECLPTTTPHMPDPNDNGPGVLQSAIADVLENPTPAERDVSRRFLPRAISTLTQSDRAVVLALAGTIALAVLVCVVVALASATKHRRT